MSAGGKALVLRLVLRALGLSNAGTLENVSKRDLIVILAAIRRLNRGI
jgi:hypothetical protein